MTLTTHNQGQDTSGVDTDVTWEQERNWRTLYPSQAWYKGCGRQVKEGVFSSNLSFSQFLKGHLPSCFFKTSY